jgi:hypothetical protein
MQANLIAGTRDVLEGKSGTIPIVYRKRLNARRYVLRMDPAGDGGCVTVPRGGNLEEARRFVRRHLTWLERRLDKLRENAGAALDRDRILFRGQTYSLAPMPDGRILLGEQAIEIGADTGIDSLREHVEHKLRKLAASELPVRVAQLAALHNLLVKRVSVRNQRSRWGSCSAKGVISLNWRLVQAPEFVRDYIIIHELMHLREMNHSRRFWKLVYETFPETRAAEQWLKSHAALLRQQPPLRGAATGTITT